MEQRQRSPRCPYHSLRHSMILPLTAGSRLRARGILQASSIYPGQSIASFLDSTARAGASGDAHASASVRVSSTDCLPSVQGKPAALSTRQVLTDENAKPERTCQAGSFGVLSSASPGSTWRSRSWSTRNESSTKTASPSHSRLHRMNPGRMQRISAMTLRFFRRPALGIQESSSPSASRW